MHWSIRTSATALFAARSFVNVVLLVSILRLFARARSATGLESFALTFACFGAIIALFAILPILIATAVTGVQYARRSPEWRSLAMRVVAAGLICDLFFLGNPDTWWVGVGMVAFDLGLWALLSYVDSRDEHREVAIA